jgi:hypothetical protein
VLLSSQRVSLGGGLLARAAASIGTSDDGVAVIAVTVADVAAAVAGLTSIAFAAACARTLVVDVIKRRAMRVDSGHLRSSDAVVPHWDARAPALHPHTARTRRQPASESVCTCAVAALVTAIAEPEREKQIGRWHCTAAARSQRCRPAGRSERGSR